MITLILENFRVFSKRQFTFDEGKCTLISGKSGVGKSTIFMAINFAVYGTGRDLVKHGKKKCMVMLKTDQIVITRSKGPERLLVEKEGIVYEKDAAQALIDAAFPHMHLGYISQLTHKSFLMLTPADKLKFVENMAFDKTFVDSINKNVKALLNERKIELEKTRKERQTMESMLISFDVEHVEHPPDGQFTVDDVSRMDNERDKYTRKANEAVQQINMKKRLEQDIRQLDACDATIDELQDKIKTLTEQEYRWTQYSTALTSLQQISRPIYSIDEIEEMINVWARIDHLDRELKKAKVLSTRLNSLQCVKPLKPIPIEDNDIDEYLRIAKKHEDLRQINVLLDALPRYRWTCAQLEEMSVQRKFAEEYTKNRQRLDELLAKKADSTMMKTCPNCKSLLGMWRGELFAVDECKTEKNAAVLTMQEATALDDEILALSIKCNGFEGILEKVHSYRTVNISTEMQRQREVENNRSFLLKKKAAIGELDEDPRYDPNTVKEVKMYAKSMQQYRSSMDEYNLIAAKLAEYADVQAERDSITIPPLPLKELQKLKKVVQDYTYLQKRCTDLKCERPLESSDTFKKMLLITTEMQSKLIQLRAIDVTDEDYRTIQSQLDDIESKLQLMKKHIKTREAYDQWKKVHDVSIVERDLEQSYPRAVKLQSIIHEAEKESLEEMLTQLNFYSQLYLEKFVDNLTIEFIFDSKISVNVIHNGHKTDINSLSGGEYARAMLAVTLALAEMHSVGILMLDESVASLDQDTTTSVLQAIKENFCGTVLCIAHQTVRGTFDRIVDL